MEETLWVEKYRPTKIEDCILPPALKKTFQAFVDKGDIPNLLLSGGPGCGKTTVALAMLEEIDADSYIVNGSLSGNIDTLRNEIANYASSVSLTGGRKFVILDEADYLNPQSTQPALRGFIQDFSKNCGFIMTCNYVNRIIEPLHSRMSVVDFRMNAADKPAMAMDFMKRLMGILDTEGVTYDKQVLAEIIQKHFPDYRRVINEVQRYAAATGSIDSGILANIGNIKIKELMEAMKTKNFKVVRQWVAKNLDNDFIHLTRIIFDRSNEYMAKTSVPQLVLILADYSNKDAFAADKEINTLAMLVEIMQDVEFI